MKNIVNKIELFRGDSIPGEIAKSTGRKRAISFARHFCGNGLMAKFADGGSSELLDNRSLLGLVLAHVGYENESVEQRLAHRSPLISFSKDKETALEFANPQKRSLETCAFFDASHFVWQFDLTLEYEIEKGLYSLKYFADGTNCMAVLNELINKEYEEIAKGKHYGTLPLLYLEAFGAIKATLDKSEHYAEIIDVVSICREFRHFQL